MIYYSQAEESFHNRHIDIITRPDSCSFDHLFTDQSGARFTAHYDFRLGNYYIEYKNHKLHNIETKEDCIIAYNKRKSFVKSAKGLHYLILNTGWNHSLFKHLAVQAVMGDKYLVVFDDSTDLSTQSINKMNSSGLNWLMESELYTLPMLELANSNKPLIH